MTEKETLNHMPVIVDVGPSAERPALRLIDPPPAIVVQDHTFDRALRREIPAGRVADGVARTLGGQEASAGPEGRSMDMGSR